MSALYIGRFQPFHLGHLDAMKQVLKKEKFVIVAIGSSEDNYTPQNPLTASERYQLIKTAMDEIKISKTKYCIIPVRNIDNYALWPNHIDIIMPPYKKIYTGSTIVETLFKQQKKHPVIKIKKNLPTSSTIIRKKILAEKKWEHLVPKNVEILLKKWHFEERLKKINNEENRNH